MLVARKARPTIRRSAFLALAKLTINESLRPNLSESFSITGEAKN